MSIPNAVKSMLAPLGAAAAIIIGGNSVIYNVDAGHRGIIYDKFRGVLDKETSEGTHFYIPIIQQPKRSALSSIYKEVGLDYEERIMPSIVTEVLKTVIAKYWGSFRSLSSE